MHEQKEKFSFGTTDLEIVQAIFRTGDIDRVSKRQLVSVIRRQQERMNTLVEALFKENPNHQLFKNMPETKRKDLFLKRFD